ncbi:MAG: hypothetical protein H6Q52_2432 [Deltaproteobacteria bacterium]|jgi:uncharacterized integral membrane protein|nr:hypothetical protein [Deltaproteobacteria bacterium]
MKIRTLLLLVILVIIAVFVAINWKAFMTQTTLSVGFANVQAPLGLVMLGLLVFLTAAFLVFAIYLQTSNLLEARRHAQELKGSRELADRAEASRFTELRGFLDSELKRQTDLNIQSRAAIVARMDELERDLRTAIEESGNALSAYIEELEDRLEAKGEPNR